MSSTKGNGTDAAHLTARQEADGEFNTEQAKDCVLRHIGRQRRKAVRDAARQCGHLILTRIVEEIHCTSRPVFEENESLTDHARATAWDAIRFLMEDEDFDYLLNCWITSDVYYQICADMKDALDREKRTRQAFQDRAERKLSLP